MRRRDCIGLLATFALFGRGSAGAQPRREPFLIAVLIIGSQAGSERHRRAFAAGLQELGYLRGRDYFIVERFAEGIFERLPSLASELVELKPDLLIAGSTSAALALNRFTRTIPIVSPALVDPIAQGLIDSYSRPGRIITGVAIATDTLPGKQIELAAELFPAPSKIGLLSDPGAHAFVAQEHEAYAAADRLGLELIRADVQAPSDLESAFHMLALAATRSLVVLPHPMFLAERRRIAALALEKRIPAIYGFREDVEAGGLMSYGIDLSDAYRRVASYVDRIRRGSAPGELPVEFPTKLELLVNLKTAKALRLELPLSMLARADEVIE